MIVTENMTHGEVEEIARQAGKENVNITGDILLGILGAKAFLWKNRVELETKIADLERRLKSMEMYHERF